MSKKGGVDLQKDAPWRASQGKPIPKIHHTPVLRIPHNPFSNYALTVMRDRNPVGNGLAVDAVLEAAGPDCIVPGQATPVKLLGLKATQKLLFLAKIGNQELLKMKLFVHQIFS
ncbi:rRNA biogenesis protein RRP36 [Bienertia sinuspersici]